MSKVAAYHTREPRKAERLAQEAVGSRNGVQMAHFLKIPHKTPIPRIELAENTGSRHRW